MSELYQNTHQGGDTATSHDKPGWPSGRPALEVEGPVGASSRATGYLAALEAAAQKARELCEFIKGDYCEDVWGERAVRVELEKLLDEAMKQKPDNVADQPRPWEQSL